MLTYYKAKHKNLFVSFNPELNVYLVLDREVSLTALNTLRLCYDDDFTLVAADYEEITQAYFEEQLTIFMNCACRAGLEQPLPAPVAFAEP